MDPNNYFSTILPQQYLPILQQQQQQIPIEHLISAQAQQYNNNNNLFATATNNILMPTLTPIAASVATASTITPAAATCYIQSAAAATAVGSSPPFSLYTSNTNNFGGNSSSLSNCSSSSTNFSFPPQQHTTQALPFQQHSSSSINDQQQLLEQSSFVQISLSPSIPQPISVIIDGQQYLEFPSTTPGEASQFIPLQLFLQPQNYIPQQSSEIVYPSITAAAPSFSSTSNLLPPILPRQTMSNLQSPSQQQSFIKMDTTTPTAAADTSQTSTTTISPPTKTRRTKSPQKKTTNENKFDRIPQTQSSMYKFLSPSQAPPSSSSSNANTSGSKLQPQQQKDDDDDSEIEIVGETIKKRYVDCGFDDVHIIETKPSPVFIDFEPSASKSASQKSRKKAANTVESTPIKNASNTQTSDKSDSIPASTRLSSSTAAYKRISNAAASVLSRSTSSTSSQIGNISPVKATAATSTSSTASSSNTIPSNSVPSSSSTSNTLTVSAAAARTNSSTTFDTSTTNSSTPNAEDQTDESSSEPLDPLQQRLQYRSTLNSRISPTFDYKMTTEIIREIVPIILEVIPNAIINGIGPAYHECGSFLNLAFNEDTREIAYIWFFFSLSIMIGDKQKRELQTPEDAALRIYIKEIQKKFEEADIVQECVSRTQRGAHKLIFEHKKINAKVTLLFCAEDACKRSQLIRLYTRFHTRMIQVAYLYNNMIMSNPALHLLTNTPLCYMIIYFLQQTDRIEVIHQSRAKYLIDNINLFQPPDYRTEDIIDKLKQNPKHINDSVAILTYEFAKFYSNFDFEKIIIDIAQKKQRCWSIEDKELQKPIAVRCCFSGKNLAGHVTSSCLSTFQKKMNSVVEAFKAGKEAIIFSSDLEEFAKKCDSKSHR